MAAPDALMYQILSRRDELNLVAAGLNGTSYGIFAPTSLSNPRFVPAELGFLRAVSWLYVTYSESGRIGTAFLVERFGVYRIDSDGRLGDHVDLVNGLRTYMQHNLDPSSPRDKTLQGRCEAWMFGQCGTRVPGTEAQWNGCLNALLTQASSFLDALLRTIRSIELDESRDAVVSDWVTRINRYHAPHEFDAVIEKVAADMGREKLDAVRLRKRFYEKWIEELRALEGGYDFELEARKLIEHTLLTEVTAVLPITGADIMQAFGIGPGPEVGRLLQSARSLYEATPCGAAALLDHLRAQRGT